jgi:hypothetical protein
LKLARLLVSLAASPRSFTFYLADPSAQLRSCNGCEATARLSIAATFGARANAPAGFRMWDEYVAPILFGTNQSCANWILTNVRKLLREALVVAKAMIKEIPLPLYAAELRSNSFEVANQLRKRVAAIDPDQRMQMIWHEQEKIQVPAAALVIDPCGIKRAFDVFSQHG